MKMLIKTLMTAGILLTTCAAQAQISVYAIRVGAQDPDAVANFYKAAFGLKEAERLSLPNGVEIMLNFGASEAQALASTAPQVVIMSRDSDAVEDVVPHLIFRVSDREATASAVSGAGGTIVRGPFEFGDSGIIITMLKDPAGNEVELIQRP